MDVNGGGDLSKIELKTGMQSLGIAITSQEFDLFWKAVAQPEKEQKPEPKVMAWSRNAKKDQKPKQAAVSYLELIKAFIDAGCIKFEKSTDRSNTLMAKYRQ